ncbi:hypothetical protein CK203_065573 [Vitis vinifera]|uniref:Uncharacterized protein n=1 Tax=Vitis vinifera TaxID=29760 RepID=A0A438FPG6_VITVI|nr:hypothetical protein CK203_065573 [Vitis vinifera]
MTALRAHQEQIIATQTERTAILRQIQHHLGILSTPEYPILILSEPTEPSQAPPFIEHTMHPEEPTTGEAETSTFSILPLQLSHHLHIILYHYLIICIVSFMCFLTIVALVIPCF